MKHPTDIFVEVCIGFAALCLILLVIDYAQGGLGDCADDLLGLVRC